MLFTIEVVSFLQSERTRFGRQYSDDESEFTYDQASELMATELASERRMKSEPAQKMLRPIKKVCMCCACTCIHCILHTPKGFMYRYRVCCLQWRVFLYTTNMPHRSVHVLSPTAEEEGHIQEERSVG